MDFENKKTHFGIHYTRYIISWIRIGGELRDRGPIEPFLDWLRSLELTEDEIDDIRFLATNGKMELEHDAYHFIKGK